MAAGRKRRGAAPITCASPRLPTMQTTTPRPHVRRPLAGPHAVIPALALLGLTLLAAAVAVPLPVSDVIMLAGSARLWPMPAPATCCSRRH